MIYYKYADLYSPIAGGVTYVETDEGVAYRQITIHGDKYLMSNIESPEWRLILAEGQIDYSVIDEVQEIGRKEFDDIWDAHLIHQRVKWQKMKKEYTPGMGVTGYIQIFYPQGVIIHLGEDRLAVANYAACRASARPEWMYPGHQVTAVVAGYDELNYWLVLEKPIVYSEVSKDYRVNL